MDCQDGSTVVRRRGASCMVPSPLCGNSVTFVDFIGKTRIKNHNFHKIVKTGTNVAQLLCAGAVLRAWYLRHSAATWSLLSASSVKLVSKITKSMKLQKLVQMLVYLRVQTGRQRCSLIPLVNKLSKQSFFDNFLFLRWVALLILLCVQRYSRA